MVMFPLLCCITISLQQHSTYCSIYKNLFLQTASDFNFTDAEEFLREIRIEEEAKAAQLKLEIKEEQLRLLAESNKKVKPKSNKKKKRKNIKTKKSEL